MFSSLSNETSKNIVNKTIFLLILGLAFGGLVLMDVRGVMSNGTGVQDVANVNGARITSRSLQSGAAVMAQRMGMSPDEAAQSPQLLQYVLQGLIADKLSAQGLDKIGLHFSDKDIANEVRAMLSSPSDKNDADMVQRYQAALRNAGMSQAEFEKGIQSTLAQRTVMEALRAGSLPDPLLEAVETAHAAERRDIALITVPNDPSSVTKEPSDKDLEALYAEHEVDFTIPETRSGVIYQLSAEALKEKGKDDPQAYIMEIEDAFASGETPENVAKTYNLVKSQTLADVARANPADPAEDTMNEALFQLDSDQVSNGLTMKDGATAFLHLTDIKPAAQKPLKDVRADVVKLWKEAQANEAAREIIAALNAAKDPIAEAGKKGLVVTRKTGIADSKEYGPLFNISTLNKAKELPGEGGDFLVGVVTKITPGQVKWTAKESSVDAFRTASETDPQAAFMQLLGQWYKTAKITVNEKALAPAAPTPVEEPAQ